MAKNIGRNTNTADVAALSAAIALDSSTSVKVADANSTRINFSISNDATANVWLKFQAASVDNDKKGIFLPCGGFYEMPTDNIYTGEISAIADSGTPAVNVTEY